MLVDGYKAVGFSAHEAEVSYLSKLEFSESEIVFMDEIRYSRNSILYYGKKFDKDYAEKVLKFLDATYSKLRELVEKSLNLDIEGKENVDSEKESEKV